MLHAYKFKDENIILDVNSGCVHLVDNVVFDVLTKYGEDYKASVNSGIPREVIEEIDELVSENMLFTEDDQVTKTMLTGRDAVIKALCLHVAHDCNLRCRYCFGDTGFYFGERSLMSLETGKKAIDFLIEKSGARRNLEVDFFGGEPLMNFDVVKAIVEYGDMAAKKRGKLIRWTMTTNALLLDDEKASYLNETMDNIVLSIDGRKEVHDNMRPSSNGKGSYETVLKNIKHMRDVRKGKYYLRGTFTKHNLDFSKDVCHLADMGFPNISMEPVVTSDDVDYRITKDDLPAVLGEYEKLADICLDYAKQGKQFAFFHFNIDPSQGPCVVKRVSGCGAGTEYVAISPEGDIYPCHQFVGTEDFKLGNLSDVDCFATLAMTEISNDCHSGPVDACHSGPDPESIFQNKLYDYFNEAHIYSKPACMDCWAKFYCSGGCHANAYFSNNDILQPDEIACALERKRVELALGIWAVSEIG
ncbi:MAG: thioether cross-link-forming SCIFF peptide maturase [Clostridiales Family XIII bacterium]|jgi:uncharacterized protein|nr:thioether cross-link-forming SCIFF peptide maturase [Clostridiales Family XIII bacterium]